MLSTSRNYTYETRTIEIIGLHVVKLNETKFKFNKTNNYKLLSGLIIHSSVMKKGLLVTRPQGFKMKKIYLVENRQEKYLHSRTGSAYVAYAMRIFSNVLAKLNLHIFQLSTEL